jgi:hypothetical protein
MATIPQNLKMKSDLSIKTQVDMIEKRIDDAMSKVADFNGTFACVLTGVNVTTAIENEIRSRYLRAGWDSMTVKQFSGDQRDPDDSGGYNFVFTWTPKTKPNDGKHPWGGTIGEG